MDTKKQKEKRSVADKVISVIGIILCVIFGTMLLCNLTIIIKGTINPDTPPSIFGVTPMVVLSGSMEGDAPDSISPGDLIFAKKADVTKLKVGDVIAFMEGKIAVTHRITEIKTDENQNLTFQTKGDANNTADRNPIKADQVFGLVFGKIPKLGDFALFLQTPLGMVLFMGIPLVAFVVYDAIRRKHYSKKEQKKNEELVAELERLRAQNGEQEQEQEREQEQEPKNG